MVLMRWGLVPFWSKGYRCGFSTINARAVTLVKARAFREALKHRRCLVPTDAFYEWPEIDAKSKQPYAIALKSGEPYGFAGIWERWKDKRTGESLESFSIITTDPNVIGNS